MEQIQTERVRCICRAFRINKAFRYLLACIQSMWQAAFRHTFLHITYECPKTMTLVSI